MPQHNRRRSNLRGRARTRARRRPRRAGLAESHSRHARRRRACHRDRNPQQLVTSSSAADLTAGCCPVRRRQGLQVHDRRPRLPLRRRDANRKRTGRAIPLHAPRLRASVGARDRDFHPASSRKHPARSRGRQRKLTVAPSTGLPSASLTTTVTPRVAREPAVYTAFSPSTTRMASTGAVSAPRAAPPVTKKKRRKVRMRITRISGSPSPFLSGLMKTGDGLLEKEGTDCLRPSLKIIDATSKQCVWTESSVPSFSCNPFGADGVVRSPFRCLFWTGRSIPLFRSYVLIGGVT